MKTIMNMAFYLSNYGMVSLADVRSMNYSRVSIFYHQLEELYSQKPNNQSNGSYINKHGKRVVRSYEGEP